MLVLSVLVWEGDVEKFGQGDHSIGVLGAVKEICSADIISRVPCLNLRKRFPRVLYIVTMSINGCAGGDRNTIVKGWAQNVPLPRGQLDEHSGLQPWWLDMGEK